MSAAVDPLVLSDGWPDGPPEERVHVAVEAAPEGGAQAVRLALAELGAWLDDLDDLALVATDRRAWFRLAPCPGCDGSGADDGWRQWAGRVLGRLIEGPAPACGSCAGTGEQDGDEGYAYRECDQLDEGAIELWVLELVEAGA